jgi:hypothetical protein
MSAGGAAGAAAAMYIIALNDAAAGEEALAVIRRKKLRKGETALNNDLLGRCAGRDCVFKIGGQYGHTVKGHVLSVRDNWVEMQTKKGNRLINADFVYYVEFVK